MNRCGSRRVAAGLFVAALFAGGAGAEQAPRKPVLDYPRAESRRRPESGARPRRVLPPRLEVVAPSAATPASSPAPEDRTRRDDAGSLPRGAESRESIATEVRRQALAAGVWSADVAVETAGRPEYFRVGFYEGMSEALQDPRIGYADRSEGERRGWDDEDARAFGAETGEQAAREAAAEDAERQVVDEFRDLSAEPRALPRAGSPSYTPAVPEVPEPTLEQVLGEFPILGFGLADPVARGWLEAWSYDALRLRRSAGYTDFYDPLWSDAGAAFERWTARADLSAYYRSLPGEPYRRGFEELFAEGFAARVAARFHTDLLPAFESGLGQGWAYGAFAHAEHEFRLGYRAGWLDAVRDSALATFDEAYPAWYEDEYLAVFDDWSSNPKPDLADVSLGDGNRDGVFEPGEELAVDYRLVNYGGVAGRLALELEGPVLESSGRIVVELPPRSAVQAERPLEARIADGVPARTDSRLELRLGDVTREISLRVSRPLQFSRGDFDLERRNLEGALELWITLRNQSLLPVDARLELTTRSRADLALGRDLGTLAAGEHRRVPLAVDGLDPLELLAGKVTLDVALLGSQGTLQDSFTCHVPDAARDLANRDLLLYVAGLSRGGATSADRLAAVRDLLVMRLREDWKVVAAGSGNPYRFDYKNDAATTALGDLVRTYLEQDPASRGHDVFAGLSGEILELAERLPGQHPFLRSYVRKLALELP